MTLTHAQAIRDEKLKNNKNFYGLRYYDALTASGLRALRTRKEIGNELIVSVAGCDMHTDAIASFKHNLELNGLTEDMVKPILGDSNQHMAMKGGLDAYEVIDLDPYGTAIPFLSNTFHALGNDGLLCVTCTDMRVLAGKDHHKCFYMYGSCRAQNIECHEENALRIAISSFNRIANEQHKGIEVLCAFQSEFYLRAYLKIKNKKSSCHDSIAKTGIQFMCPRCNNSHLHVYGGLKEGTTNQYKSSRLTIPSSNCEICGSQYEINGPIWTGKLYDESFVQKLLDNLNECTQKDRSNINPELKN